LLPKATEIAKGHDLEILWLSDSEALCARRDKTVFIAERSYTTRGTIKIASGTREEVQRLGSIVINELGLAFQRWWRHAN
jgi:hypothetical protein